jgi:hypothetical protein
MYKYTYGYMFIYTCMYTCHVCIIYIHSGVGICLAALSLGSVGDVVGDLVRGPVPLAVLYIERYSSEVHIPYVCIGIHTNICIYTQYTYIYVHS